MPRKKKTTSKWDGNISQEEFMYKDECIILNDNDDIIGHNNKYICHQFNKKNPRGILHRAFSIFLFNEHNELLLQQRAAEKITFPNVWTNTCCSHPLYGQEPNEVDINLVENITGVKYAAIRKLKQELGIELDAEKYLSRFTFLTRLHYWACDTITHGDKTPWGEHEIDYVLFIKLNSNEFNININKEEVQDIQYVSYPQLIQLMEEGVDQQTNEKLLWSPWFRIITYTWLKQWWNDLDVTINTDTFVDLEHIHRFDPPTEHMGGLGEAYEYLGNATNSNSNSSMDQKERERLTLYRAELAGLSISKSHDTSSKQGGYGKIPIHKDSKFIQLLHFDEICKGIYYKLNQKKILKNKIKINNDENIKFCDDMLGKVSRSFAAVIRQLPEGLCLDILIFYLVLRGLDTVEDEMNLTLFNNSLDYKINILRQFYQTALVEDDFHIDNVGEGDERTLLSQFYKVTHVFKSLSYQSQEVISDITMRMGAGMAEFVSKDLGQGTININQYNQYCHYVAGLVGEGLSRLFSVSNYESKALGESHELSNSMGLFLQKTNIIRDYLEDLLDGRAFWPQEIWEKYTYNNDLGELADPKNRSNAIACLNELVTDALELVPQCLTYMSLLHQHEVFRFCAIPQVMAIATLDKCYNNKSVFTGVVKIRKGLSVKMILDTTNIVGLHYWFYKYAHSIKSQINKNDPNYERTKSICNHIIQLTEEKAKQHTGGIFSKILTFILPILLAATSMYALENGTIDPLYKIYIYFFVFICFLFLLFFTIARFSN